MTDHKRAKVYALDKIGPINVGAGMNDYICKAFGQTVEGDDIVVQINKDEFEGHAKALLAGQAAEVLCDPSRVLSLKLNMQRFNRNVVPESVSSAIEETRAKSVRTT